MTRYFIRLTTFCPLSLALLTIGLASPASYALENTPAHCAAPLTAGVVKTPTEALAEKAPSNPVSSDDPAIYLSADSITSTRSNQFDIDGNVSIQTNRRSINSDTAQYNQQQQHLSAQGSITYREKDLFIESDSLDISLKSGAGKAENTKYHLFSQNTNGIAGQITFKGSQVKLEESTYSTCEDENKAWQIRAKTIELHPENNEGIARNMRLEILNVPVLYLPYISFPLQGRKSGFLAPRPSYSEDEGFDIAIPYYFNLKPNYDLTVTPRFIDKRGAQGSAKFRYLQQKSSGSLGAEVLPNDKQNGADRAHFTLSHQSQFSETTNYNIEYAQVTDKQYFSDLGSELNTVNTTQLSRGFQSETRGRNWLFHTVIQDYQMLDNNPEPYRRVPQFNLNILDKIGPLQWRTNAQYSYFQKNSADYIHRAVITPNFALPLKRQYGYFIPSAGIRAAAYQLSSPEQRNEHFINWQFNTKTGLYFERNTDNAVQTLTPELQYTYIPAKTQSTLPLIDTDLLNYDIAQLFTINRYSGYDRQGNENRLSWSLSTDYTRNSASTALFYAQLAQAVYLSEHKSLLDNEKPINKDDVVNAAIIKGNLNSHVSAVAQAYHFSGESRLNNGNMSLNYKNSHEQVEMAYRFRDKLVEQVSVVGILDVSSQWRIASRWLYSLNNKRTREALLGLEYNNCCWAVRLMGRQYASQGSTDLHTSIGVQIELKGLTRIGSSLDKQFSDEVFGNQ
ncbi:MAG: LPS assembly protein LptD [Gammaproteobacteria bacterium]|nr:LPS assembly protein LptD [Gammaproteobacteria bacterium]